MKKLLFTLISIASMWFMLSASAEVSQAAIDNYIQFANQAANASAAQACQAVTINDTNFCPDFVTNTICVCKQHDAPFACTMQNIYDYIVKNLGYQVACESSLNKNIQDCVHDWQCYMTGQYVNSFGKKVKCPQYIPSTGCSGHPTV